MKKSIYAINCLMLLLLITEGIRASEKKTSKLAIQPYITSLENFPEEVIKYEIIPNLDDKSLLNLALSSKKYYRLSKNELAIRKQIIAHFTNFSTTDLNKLINSPEILARFLTEDTVLKDLNLSNERGLRYAIIALQRKNILNQQDAFKKELSKDGKVLELRNKVVHQVLYKDAFQNFKNLEELDLSDNQLTQLDPAIFKELKNLKWLYLSHNQLTQLDPSIFKYLNNLEGLELDSNKLTNLNKNVFKELKNLIRLDLCDNQLVSLDNDLFKELKNLKWLDLSQNQLVSLNNAIFKSLKNLQYLFLQHNNLAKIEPVLLKNLKNLKDLDLSWNELTQFDPAIVESLKKLEYFGLHLDGNKISERNLSEIKQLLDDRRPLCYFK